MEICFEKDTRNISFLEIALKVVSKLWYPVNYFKLSFGNQDQCSRYVKEIKETYHLDDSISETDLYDFLLKKKDLKLLKGISNELIRYVPYRFIRPWYSKSIRGIIDAKVNSSIIKLQGEEAPYIINLSTSSLLINTDWYYWIKTNFKLIESFTYFELIKYLEKQNPNVTSLSLKLVKPITRSLNQPTKIWKNFTHIC